MMNRQQSTIMCINVWFAKQHFMLWFRGKRQKRIGSVSAVYRCGAINLYYSQYTRKQFRQNNNKNTTNAKKWTRKTERRKNNRGIFINFDVLLLHFCSPLPWLALNGPRIFMHSIFLWDSFSIVLRLSFSDAILSTNFLSVCFSLFSIRFSDQYKYEAQNT